MRLFLAAVFVLWPLVATAQERITFRWDAVADATGYFLFVGASPGAETITVDVGNALETEVPFNVGVHYVHARSYNTSGRSLQASNEVVVTIAPPPNPCTTDPLVVRLTSPWPRRKDQITYTAVGFVSGQSYRTTYRYDTHGQTVENIYFTEIDRQCPVYTLTRP